MKDATGQALGYFYLRASRAALSSKVLARDEARRIAANFAKLPELRQQKADSS